MISGIIGVVCAVLFILVVSIGIKVISTWGMGKKNIEGIIFFKAVFLSVFSIAVLIINSKYFLLDAMAKAGLTVAVLLVACLPVLVILKSKKQKTYEDFVNMIERYIV
ncbi:hypothetical protein [Bacillus sp. Marseille-Q1617]|uniref:hypothetical protein n=1 Tax=Bacillus sp. Marseille-Q1617 TaxID=2736887 RepID=UPI00158C3809|nr:hypothetical protein [Bacillus sp. Marseille-Q1617]